MRGELETEQNYNILTPTLLAITAFLTHSPGLLNWGPGGPASLGHVPHSSIFSATAQSGVLRAPSTGCWFSLQHLISNWSEALNSNCSIGGPEGPFCWVLVISTASYHQLTRTSCAPSYIIVLCPLNSTCPRSRLYPDIPQLDVPVIYTGAFPILTAWPGRRSICNIC